MKKINCDLYQRELGKKINTWILTFYDSESITVCEECSLSVNEQIIDNLEYFWKLKNGRCKN